MEKTQRQRNLRRLFRSLWIYFLKLSGLLYWAERKISASSGVVVLTLHRVLPDPAFQETNSPEGMVVRCRTFERLLRFLLKNFEVVGLRGDFPEPDSKSTRPRIALTFDDGWKDTAVVTYPLALKYGIPFTVFVCSGLMGQVAPFWPEQVTRSWRKAAGSISGTDSIVRICEAAFPGDANIRAKTGRLDDLIAFLKTLPSSTRDKLVQDICTLSPEDASPASDLEGTMSWDEARALDHGLCEIGSHSENHEILTVVPLDYARQGIANSKRQIEEHLGHECKVFAYPNGSWSKEVRDLIQREEYTLAFVNSPGVWTRETDPWLIPRVNTWEGSLTNRSGDFSPTMFQYSVFWRAHRRQK